MVKTIVGSGGKTTLIRQLAQHSRAQGLRVFVTTTTHMFIEDDTLLTDNPQTIIDRLVETGYAMAGIPIGNKIGPLSPETYNAVCQHADVILVEGDGSKHKPIKFPAEHEPVIPDNTDEIIVVCGIHALGKPVSEVSHRPELVTKTLNISGETPVCAEHILSLVLEGYVLPLREKFPDKGVSVYASHDSTPAQAEAAAWIMSNIECI